ncbi:MAG: hypothetical protein C4562_06310 [Actinobacteria bacterium]|nr:MAG: hypothetical protein C4562_06310 [Actinomycetota bacterium]
MLPHPKGETKSIAEAFSECSLGLKELNDSDLDESSKAWIKELNILMDTTGIEDKDSRGLFTLRAEMLTLDQKIDLSRTINELADWFNRCC